MKNSVLVWIFLVAFPLVLQAQEDLNVIQPQWVNFTDGQNALYKHLTKQAFTLLDKREQEIKEITTLEGWKERQAWTEKTLMEVVGPFPEKTPLNPTITRTIQKEGYSLEHVVFESQPSFFVTATLFIPEGSSGKKPAIIYCSGHTLEGYRSATYQHVILNLVKKGFIVLAFDPVGQGERLEYFNPQTNEPTIGGPTKQHSYPGAQAFIAGSSQARYMIWDGIRAVDYLLTRPEVDPKRIGITGRSGGGTQSSYIAAFDDRIYAAAPENYITTFKRLWLTHGPQDAEQNFYRGISAGLDQPDLMMVRAPKPGMMIITTRDIFNIEGAREAAAQIQRPYESYGSTENFEVSEDDAAHASTPKNREAMYAFFQKHLNLSGSSKDEIVDSLSKEELQVTPTGQVLTSYKGKRVFDMNQRYLNPINNTPSKQIEASNALSGYIVPEGDVESMMTGRFQRDGYVVEKYLIKGEGDYWIPYLLMKPNTPTQSAIIYLNPEGKGTDALVGGDMESLVRSGTMVLAPDLLNTGEMGRGGFTGDSSFEGNSYNIWFGSILIGRSVVGIQAGDTNRLVNYLQSKQGAKSIKGVAKGNMGSVLLHAAAFNPAISSVALIDPLMSFEEIVRNPQYDPAAIEYTVAGALSEYDLPGLVEALSDRNPLLLQTQETSTSETSLLQEQLRNTSTKSGVPTQSVRTKEELREVLGRWVRE
ncbi:alpha/beta hydrolase family protein [Lunatibacter salilacus]|uniref:alpha/beta hydrolase family protein n=1 Tax=Lunatibacter salilacus TaxID=2483804 RepID=UPI00131BF667|nr:acetylxylan esterase [Lunatibacter salilacus]